MLERITVETTNGPVTGRSKEGTYLFAGLPYAAPPLEQLRFKPPQPHTPWVEPLSALKFGPAAPQVSSGGLTDSAPIRYSEDCLTLNISTPACDDAKRAVLVWIHGGGYRTGQGSIPWYNGTQFNRNGDIVVVSINYRLGALGFTDLSHLGEEFELSGVCGTLDQIAALRWVKDNISAFGGDPQRVTLAGESAGGYSVATLLGCPSAQGLFHQAITQSGAAHSTLPKAAAEIVSQHFLEALGVDDALALETIGIEEILAAQNTTIKALERPAGVVNKLNTSVSAFYPNHGNKLLTESPLEAIKSGCGSKISVLTGTNKDETTLWGYGNVDEEKLARTAAAYGATEALDIYRQERSNSSLEDLMIALTTDYMFRVPALRMAEARIKHTNKTWLYLFSWPSRAFNGRLKATHALEIPFAFDNLGRAGVAAFIGEGEKPQHIADCMHGAWINFINNGDPGWAIYELTDRTTMVFNDTSKAQNDPAAAERIAWQGLR